MAERPTSAFVFSLIGGFITLVTTVLVINTWFSMYSEAGWTFHYSLWYLVGSIDLTAAGALALFIIGVACGALIIIGAILQYSADMSKVRRGSFLVLAATIVGIVPTTFGLLIGGLLSITGAGLGLAWKPAISL